MFNVSFIFFYLLLICLVSIFNLKLSLCGFIQNLYIQNLKYRDSKLLNRTSLKKSWIDCSVATFLYCNKKEMLIFFIFLLSFNIIMVVCSKHLKYHTLWSFMVTKSPVWFLVFFLRLNCCYLKKLSRELSGIYKDFVTDKLTCNCNWLWHWQIEVICVTNLNRIHKVHSGFQNS